MTLADRFWNMVETAEGGCWTWHGSRRRGYGRFYVGNGCTEDAHRLAWKLTHGVSLPRSLNVLHSCDNPPCVNPAHLFLGTQRENIDDMNRKGRNGHAAKTHCPFGHEYTEQNIRRYGGKRRCRACETAQRRERDGVLHPQVAG